MRRTLATTLELCTWSLLLAGVCSQGCGGTAIEPDDEYAYDFEVGAQGWTAEGGNNVASVSRAQAQHGEQSLEVVTDLDSADDWWSVAIVRDPATLPKAGDLISGWVWVPEDHPLLDSVELRITTDRSSAPGGRGPLPRQRPHGKHLAL